MANTGTGATITCVTSGFTARWRQIGALEESVAVLDDTPLSAVGHMEKVPGDLIDLGPMELEVFWDPDVAGPTLGVPESMILTFPLKSGQTNGATRTGTGFFSARTSPVLNVNDRQIGTFVVQMDGKTSPTVTPGS